MAFNEDSSASGHDEPWIQWFCGLKGHEMFCEVERSYIEDGFNLYGLRACVSNFSDCLDLILDRIGPDDSDDSHLTQSACTLYGLIHARYIITAHGLDAMYSKYANKDFGTCPLVPCTGQPVLPVGIKDEMGVETVKIFCPKCNQVYHTPPMSRSSRASAGVDGAAFGTTFPHLFLMTFSNLVPDPLAMDASYIPRVFGFRVNKATRAPIPMPPQQPHQPNNGISGPQQQQLLPPPVAQPRSNSVPSVPSLTNDHTSRALSYNNNVAVTAAVTAAKDFDNEDEEESVRSPMTASLQGDPDDDKSNLSPAANASAAANLRNSPTKSNKRRKSSTEDTTKPPAGQASTTNNGPSGPTFLMENPVKRRRRNNNSA